MKLLEKIEAAHFDVAVFALFFSGFIAAVHTMA